jgi:hypothetical protein
MHELFQHLKLACAAAARATDCAKLIEFNHVLPRDRKMVDELRGAVNHVERGYGHLMSALGCFDADLTDDELRAFRREVTFESWIGEP